LLDVLRVLVVWPWSLSATQIACTLDIDPVTVKSIILGTDVFHIYGDGDVQLLPYVEELLQDANRAGEYYILPKDLNPNYNSMYAKIQNIYWIIV